MIQEEMKNVEPFFSPAITNARVAGAFKLGNNAAVVLTDCDSLGLIRYVHMMYVIEPKTRELRLAIAAEEPDKEDLRGGRQQGYTLWTFSSDKIGCSGERSAVSSLEGFTHSALTIAASFLNIDDPPIEIPKSELRSGIMG
jgi:hypothetical protein